MVKWKPLLQESVVYPWAFWGVGQTTQGEWQWWMETLHAPTCIPSSAENTGLKTGLHACVYVSEPLLVMVVVDQWQWWRAKRWYSDVCRCVGDLFCFYEALTPLTRTEHRSSMWVTSLPTALASCVSMWFVCLCVFMSNPSMCVDLCLNSQLLKVPSFKMCSFFTDWATCFTH